MAQTTDYYPGFDILKYFLSIFIVAAHCELLNDSTEFIFNLCSLIESFAIPTFFAVSAYLFCDRINRPGILKKTVTRTIILFAIWYIIMFPMTYIRFYSIASLKEIIYAILLTCTLNGYWFFKALIFNTIILYFAYKGGAKRLRIVFIISLAIYLFFAYNYIYHYLEINISPYYSFFYHTAYFFIGAFFYLYAKRTNNNIINRSITVCAIILLILLSINNSFHVLSRLIMPLLLMSFFRCIKSANSSFYKRLRALSILFYTMQFLFIWIYQLSVDFYFNEPNLLSDMLRNSIIRFIIIISILHIISATILALERKYKVLHYLH